MIALIQSTILIETIGQLFVHMQLIPLSDHVSETALRLDNTSQGPFCTAPVFFNNLEYGIGSILYSNLSSLDSQIKFLFNDVNHNIIANQYSFCGIREHKKNTFSLLFFA